MVKNKIRKSLLEQGQLLSRNFIKDTNQNIQNIVLNEIDVKSSKNTLLYFPYKNEISVELIIEELWKYSNNIYMPKIVSDNELKFNLLKRLEVLEKNKFGIKEISSNDYLDPMNFDTMFIPFVGVDKAGARLGYGGGYFDKTLENINSSLKKPLIVGIGYDFQIIDDFFGEDHDIKYDIVITESRVLYFS